jgi:PIN domain nuclease of toxin-antitoxin system
MRLLLDTQVVLWWFRNDQRLGPLARQAIAAAQDVAVSAVTPWEIAIKVAIGKLDAPAHLLDDIEQRGLRRLPVTFEHAKALLALPPVHRDPFDRMLIAQAVAEKLTLISSDSAFARYAIDLVDATR